MDNRIQIIKQAGRNIQQNYLLGKLKAEVKPENMDKIIGVGIAAAETAKILLESNDSEAVINVEQDGRQQKTVFQYDDNNGVSAQSTYSYSDEKGKRLYSENYDIQPGHEISSRSVIDYINAPITESTQQNIDKINSNMAQMVGYKSLNTEYDPQDLSTYGPKTTSKKFPAIFGLLSSLFPTVNESKMGIKVKEKYRSRTDSSVMAFEGTDLPLKGLVSAKGDKLEYYIDTPEMTVIGQNENGVRYSSTAYLKNTTNNTEPEDNLNKKEDTEDTEDTASQVLPTQGNNVMTEQCSTESETPDKTEQGNPNTETKETPAQNDAVSDTSKTMAQGGTDSEVPKTATPENNKHAGAKRGRIKSGGAESLAIEQELLKEQKRDEIIKAKQNAEPVYKKEEYATKILDILAAKIDSSVIQERAQRVNAINNILAQALLDGYNDLSEILTLAGMGLISKNQKDEYIKNARLIAVDNNTSAPTVTEAMKAKKIIDERFPAGYEAADDLEIAIIILFKERFSKLEDYGIFDEISEDLPAFLDQQYDQKTWKKIEEKILSKNDEDLTVICTTLIDGEYAYENCQNLQKSIEELLNQIPDSSYNQRTLFSNNLYSLQQMQASDKKVQKLENLKQKIRAFLNSAAGQTEQNNVTVNTENPTATQPKAFDNLSAANKKLVKKIINAQKMPSLDLTQTVAVNLLKDIGFEERKQCGDHADLISGFCFKNYKSGEDCYRISFSSGGRELDLQAKKEIQNLCKQLYENNI